MTTVVDITKLRLFFIMLHSTTTNNIEEASTIITGYKHAHATTNNRAASFLLRDSRHFADVMLTSYHYNIMINKINLFKRDVVRSTTEYRIVD